MRARDFIRWYINTRLHRPYVPPPPIVQPPTPPTDPVVDGSTTALDSHNKYRAREGLKPLAANRDLDNEAGGWAAVLAERGGLSHEGFLQRVRAAGFSTGSENLYWASWKASGVEATAGWMDSKGHKANVLNGQWTHAGFGYADGRGGRYWVGIYGR